MRSSFGAEKELQYPIHLAISLGKSIDCVRALIEHGADCNARTSNRATALELRLEMGDGKEEIIGFLLARGADPNAGVSTDRTTMLHIAAALGLAQVVSLLIASGGDPRLLWPNTLGQSPRVTSTQLSLRLWPRLVVGRSAPCVRY
jgi:ankyrin repeat protein